jgi:hypothetical protein
MSRTIVDARSPEIQAFAAAIRRATIEEVAIFVETHCCVIDDWQKRTYKVEERKPHPCEPLALAIRGLKELQ